MVISPGLRPLKLSVSSTPVIRKFGLLDGDLDGAIIVCLSEIG